MATMEETLTGMRTTISDRSGEEGRKAGFDEVFRRYLRPLYAFAYYRTGNQAAAEDITSQVFEKAWRSYARFDPGRASVSSWLFAIARNCVIDHLRRQKRRPETPLVDDPGSSVGDPGQQLQVQEDRRQLYEALNGLDGREREVISLKFGGGLSNLEIASLMELTPSNVGTILCRSLEKLNSRLKGVINDD